MSTTTRYLSDAQLAELRRLSPLRGLGSFAFTWALIASSFVLYCRWPGVLTFLVMWVVVSTRHLALAILMHEAAHCLVLRSKRANELVGNWLAAYPTMVKTEVYRAYHLVHHRETWTDADPDLELAKPFPITRSSFWRKVLRDLTGQTGWQRYRMLARLSSGLSPKGQGLEGRSLGSVLRDFVATQRGFLITNGAMLAALTAAGHPEAYLLGWVLPAFTGYSLVLRLRSIAEHAAIDDAADPLRNTRTTIASLPERLFLAPHNVNFHLEHHLFMFVPHYRLPAAHRMLLKAGVLDDAEIASGYLDVLRRATSKPESAESAA
ncbi:MAG: fatty acid desaturase family protein [Polyangiaceae bacterium]|nr:fatty acid desaturase family protein [Polyangiaceae bacterium]